jgi:WD40 repeat protein
MSGTPPDSPESVARREAVAIFARSINREAHVLRDRPDLVWQQLYNRLQWEPEPVSRTLAGELARRSAPGATPWMKLLTPLRESQSLVRTLEGHTGIIHNCAISPDASYIVSGSWDKTLKIWDAATGKERATLKGHTAKIDACAISPDGSYIVSGSEDKTLKIWDAATGKERVTLRGHTSMLSDCAISPDGSFVVSAGADKILMIWESASGRERATLRGHKGEVNACAVSPDGTFVVSASSDGTLKLWDAVRGKERATLRGHDKAIAACGISPDGSYIVSAGQDGTLKIWDASRAKERATLRGHTDKVIACRISPDGLFVVSAGRDNFLRIWDAASGRERASFRAHEYGLWTCAISPDGSFIVSASFDDTLKIWEAASGRERATLKGHAAPVFACAISPDGSFIVSAGDDQTLKIWDPKSAVAGTNESASGRTDFNPGDSRVFPEFGDGGLSWSTILGEDLSEIPRERIRAHSPDGSFVALSNDDRSLTVRETAGGKNLVTIKERAQSDFWGCALSPDGSYFVSTSYEKTMTIWDTSTGQELFTALKARLFAISPDGSYLVYAREEGPFNRFQTPRIWDAALGRERVTLRGHTASVNACSVSPDGSWIVSASVDKTLKIWGAVDGRERATLRGHNGDVRFCAVSPFGSFIVSSSVDSTLSIWDPVSGAEYFTLFSRLPVGERPFAISPDTRYLASGREGKNLEVVDVRRGAALSLLPFPGNIRRLAFHPSQPQIVCDVMGQVYRIDLVGIDYGALVATAVDRGSRLELRCPACRKSLTVKPDGLGCVIICPAAGCGAKLFINRFALQYRRGVFPNA